MSTDIRQVRYSVGFGWAGLDGLLVDQAREGFALVRPRSHRTTRPVGSGRRV